jgi:hypothetical protein
MFRGTECRDSGLGIKAVYTVRQQENARENTS